MTTRYTRQLQQYTQDNYNNTHKTTNKNTHLKIQHVEKVNNAKVRKYNIIIGKFDSKRLYWADDGLRTQRIVYMT